jgi:iron complex transport system ATP-binding protein
MTGVLSAEGLGLRRANRWILRNFTIDLRQRTVLAVVGPNGSGKSSLLRCMAGLWPATEGRVALEGRDLREISRPQVACAVTFVPQEAKLEFEFTVREIVSMGRYAHRGRFERETSDDRNAVEEALARADVAYLAERPVTHLSGGERQRVLIARSLATRSRILLLDEPTASLDVEHGLDVLELCRSLADEGRTVAIATHDLNGACRFADRVALLDSGRLVGAGSPSAVLTSENLERAFHVHTEAVASGDGSPFLIFHRLKSQVQDSVRVREQRN